MRRGVTALRVVLCVNRQQPTRTAPWYAPQARVLVLTSTLALMALE
jgi:hypothetical protein